MSQAIQNLTCEVRVKHPSSAQITLSLGAHANRQVTRACSAMFDFARCGDSESLLGRLMCFHFWHVWSFHFDLSRREVRFHHRQPSHRFSIESRRLTACFGFDKPKWLATDLLLAQTCRNRGKFSSRRPPLPNPIHRSGVARTNQPHAAGDG